DGARGGKGRAALLGPPSRLAAQHFLYARTAAGHHLARRLARDPDVPSRGAQPGFVHRTTRTDRVLDRDRRPIDGRDLRARRSRDRGPCTGTPGTAARYAVAINIPASLAISIEPRAASS